MPLFSYFDNLEPDPQSAEIWRFLPLRYYEDLLANQELHFTRADGFSQDEEEGIPPEDYLRRVLGTRRHVLEDETELSHQMGSLAQNREAYYVLCWHLHRHETVEMWNREPRPDVAICSRYDLLKAVMAAMLDTTHVGLMRYGVEQLEKTGRFNVWQFINTKRKAYEGEREVRAIIEGQRAGDNRHFDVNNFPHSRPLPENSAPSWLQSHKRRRIDLGSLILGVVISPFANDEVRGTAKHWVAARKLSCEVRLSSLKL